MRRRHLPRFLPRRRPWTDRPLPASTHRIEITYLQQFVLETVQKLFIAVFALMAALPSSAATRFVAPLADAQAIGPQLLQVETDAPSVDRVDFFVDGILAGVSRSAPWRIAFDFGTSLDARSLEAKVWTGGFTAFETASVTTAALTASESIDVDLVEVPLRLRSARAVRPSDIRIRENGVEQTIREVLRERPAAHFAFVVDRSLSMTGGKLNAALAAIEEGLAHLRPGDTASLVFFNHLVAQAQPIAAGAALTDAIPSPSGGTSLRDALASVVTSDRTYAIVVTDGGDRNSELTDEEALRRISGTKTIVNAIVLGSSHTRFLDRASANTGGSVVSATKATVASALARMLEDINSRYLVVYQSTSSARGWRSIDVRAQRRAIQVVSARKGYYAR